MTKKPTVSPDDVCAETHQSDLGKPGATEILDQTEAQRMGEFFAVLADPTRLRLLSLLTDQEFCVCDLASRLGMTESAISHQLRSLRAGRLVSYRKVGRQVFYRLNDHHIHDLYVIVREHLAE